MINYLNYDFHLGYSVDGAGARVDDDEPAVDGFWSDAGAAGVEAAVRSVDIGADGRVQRGDAAVSGGEILGGGICVREGGIAVPELLFERQGGVLHGRQLQRFVHERDGAGGFKSALEEYTTSDMRSKYLYGLETIDYREGKYEDALKNHAFITNLYAESDIRPDADYLAGEIHFLRKNYNGGGAAVGRIKAGVAVVFVRAVHAGDHQCGEQEDGGGGREPEEHHSGHDAGRWDAAVAGRGEHEAWSFVLRAGGAAERGGGVQAGS